MTTETKKKFDWIDIFPMISLIIMLHRMFYTFSDKINLLLIACVLFINLVFIICAGVSYSKTKDMRLLLVRGMLCVIFILDAKTFMRPF
jgi:hypothetical protein